MPKFKKNTSPAMYKKPSSFKMNGFSGFGDSVKSAVIGGLTGVKKTGNFKDEVVKKFIDKPIQKINSNNPDRTGSKDIHPTGFETKIPRINKLKKLKV